MKAKKYSSYKFALSVLFARGTLMVKTFKLVEGKLTKDQPGRIGKGNCKVYTIGLEQLAEKLQKMKGNMAIALGTPDMKEVGIVTKAKFKTLPPSDKSVIPKDKNHFKFRNQPTLCLLDVDGASHSVEEVLDILASVCPRFEQAGKCITYSSSSGLFFEGKPISKKGGTSAHVFVVVENGTDIPRFIKTLFKRLWLAGHGHIEISKAGSLLTRGLIDESVGSPERLVYEAPPKLQDGITQERPTPKYIPGDMLDSSLLLDLTPPEENELARVIGQAKEEATPDALKVQSQYNDRQVDKIVKESGISEEKAIQVVTSRRNHVLEDEDLLYFAHQNGAGVSVSEVLAHGKEYDKKSIADPIEPDYDGGSLTKAIFYWNDGNPIIHSFAHGSVKYTFKRYEEEPTWSFDDAETVLINAEVCVSSSRGRMELATDILNHNTFEIFEIDIVRNLIKRHLKLNKGAQDKVIKGAQPITGGEGDVDDMTHWEIADSYISKQLPIQPEVVGAEGALWLYDDESGLYEQHLLTNVEDIVGRDFDGKNCKKGSDYRAIARLVYNKIMIEDFFENAPYGIAALSGFIRITEEGIVETEPYMPDHRQRYKLRVDPEHRDAPLFFQYLTETFAGDNCEEELILLQEIMGGLVTGCFNKLQRAILLIGTGSNGKSVFLELLEHMFPPGLKAAVPPDTFDNEYYRAMLAGKIINIVGELDKTASLKSVFKDIIGCDTPLSARMPYKEPFTYKPIAAHIFASNHFPQTKDHTHGFYRRWVVLDFKNTVEDDKKIANLGAKIAAEEMPQVLAWALVGAERLVKNKFVLSLTSTHEAALEKWKNTKDSVFCFLGDDEVVETHPGERTPKKDVYAVYREWSMDMGVKAVGYHEFLERCRLKYQEVKWHGERHCFADLRLVRFLGLTI